MTKSAHDIVQGLSGLHAARAKTIAREATGIEPGYDPSTGIAWTEDGRARSRRGGVRSTIASATNTSVATGSSDHDVPFDSGDTASWVDGTPAMVLPRAGTVLVVVTMNWQLASGSPFTSLVGDHQLRIQQMRSAVEYDSVTTAHPAPNTTAYFENHTTTAIFDVAAGDIINLQASHNAGVTLKCFGDVRIAYI